MLRLQDDTHLLSATRILSPSASSSCDLGHRVTPPQTSSGPAPYLPTILSLARTHCIRMPTLKISKLLIRKMLSMGTAWFWKFFRKFAVCKTLIRSNEQLLDQITHIAGDFMYCAVLRELSTPTVTALKEQIVKSACAAFKTIYFDIFQEFSKGFRTTNEIIFLQLVNLLIVFVKPLSHVQRVA